MKNLFLFITLLSLSGVISLVFPAGASAACTGYNYFDSPSNNATLNVGNSSELSGWSTFCDGPSGTNRNRLDLHVCDQNTWNNCRYIGAGSSYWRQDVVNASWTCGNLNSNADGWQFNWAPDSSFVGAKTIRSASINDATTTCVVWSERNVNITLPTPPTPSVSSSPSCTSGDTGSMYTISWAGSNPQVTWVDISTSSNFSSFWNKYVAGSTSTPASSGFSGGFAFQPNTTYYVRLWNGYTHSSATSFTTPGTCPTPTPTPTPTPVPPPPPSGLSASCPAPGSAGSLNWNSVSGAAFYSVYAQTSDHSFDWSRACTSPNYCQRVYTPSASFSTSPGASYQWFVTAGNSGGESGVSGGPTFRCIPNCNTGVSCSSSCSAPSNTCSTNNGTKGGCVYTTYSGGGSCNQISAPNQNCTVDNCSSGSGYYCSGGSCVLPTPPTPSVSPSPSCTSSNTSSMYTISWNSTSPAVSYVDIATSSNFSNFYNKAVSGTSTPASSGFSGGFAFQPNTTYYVRLWNGYTHSSTRSFTTPSGCPPSQPSSLSAACPIPGTTGNLSWNAVSGADFYSVYAQTSDHSFDWSRACTSPNYCQRVYTNSASFGTTPGSGYNWYVASGNSYAESGVSGSSFTCSSNNAQYISQSVPSTMTTGQTTAVSVTMKNTGNTTWTSGNNYRLGSQNPQDNGTWGTTRVNLPSNVSPGSTVTFTFNITAPTAPGTYNFQWRMVQEGVQWFGDSSSNIGINTTYPVPPTPSISINSSCTSGDTSNLATISWNSASPAVSYVDIATSSNFSNFYNKAVSGTSTPASSGFSGGFAFQPNTTYYVRLWNGYTHSAVKTFTTPNICPPSNPSGVSASCPVPGTTINLSWNGVSGASRYDTYVYNTAHSWSWPTACTAPNQCGSVSPPTTSKSYSSSPGNYNSWIFACNTGGCSSGVQTAVTCVDAPTPSTPSISSNPSCTPANTSSMYTISWNSTSPAVSWVDISTDNFASAYHKAVSGTSTSASSGFEGFAGVSGSLTLQPNITYYVRLWNGYKHSATASFTTPVTCTCNGYTIIDAPSDGATYTTGTRYTPSGWATFCSGPSGTSRNRVDPYICDQDTWNNCQYVGPASSDVRQDVVNASWTCGNLNPNPDGWSLNWTPDSSFLGAKTLRVASINDAATTCVIWQSKNINITAPPTPTPTPVPPTPTPTPVPPTPTPTPTPTSTPLPPTGNTQKHELSGNQTQSSTRAPIDLSGNAPKLYHISGNYTIASNIDMESPGVIFVDGDLGFASPLNRFTYGNKNAGVVFIVGGNVNVDPEVRQIDALIITFGQFCSAGSYPCPNSVTVNNPLLINGSVVALSSDPAKKPMFVRNLRSGNGEPAEKIAYQAKYLVILKDVFARTRQIWTELTDNL